MARRLLGVLTAAALCSAVVLGAAAPPSSAPVATPAPAATAAAETYQFQAEVSRLMDILVNSLYQKKEIFLRELISNANDALDKIRYLSLSDDSLLGVGESRTLEIRISADKEAKTLTIRDTGVGMTKADLIAHLGTVAKSGTAAFMEQAASGGDLSLIGQFGVGFYSVYLAADRVKVVSKHNDDTQHVWESTADGTFSVAEDPRGNTLGRGTEITLYLKDDATEYVESDRLRSLIKKYSEFITFPIYLEVSKFEQVEVPAADASADAATKTAAEEEGEEDVEAEEATTPSSTPKPSTTHVEVKSWELMNEQKAIWQRKPKDITEEEYSGFYRAITKAATTEEPIGYIHFTAEGEVEFRSILYIPATAPSDLYDNYYAKSSSLRLYVRKVLISDEFDELLPRYLAFIAGVVDSDDLPLNVSRETLQQHKILKVMGKKLVRKTLEMFKKLADDQDRARAEEEEEKKDGSDGEGKAKKEGKDVEPLRKGAASAYDKFWTTFGKNIKLGIIEDASNRSKLSKLLRFKSTKSTSAAPWRSLDQYVADMADGQRQIYFIAGETEESLKASPFLERLTAANLEVLFMTDPIDEYAVQNLPEFENFKLQSITKEGLVLPGEGTKAKARDAVYAEEYKPLLTYLKTTYGDRVEKVTVSNRLTDTPCVLVTSSFGYSANMERIVRSQAFADPSRAKFMMARKTMEVNPRHPLIAELNKRAAAAAEGGAGAGTTAAETADLAMLLLDTALLNSGFTIDDTKDFSGRMYRMMKAGLSLDSLDLLPEVEIPDEPEVGDETEEGEGVDDADADADIDAGSDEVRLA